MTHKLVRDYYQIILEDYARDDPEERARLAILTAGEIARIYAVPCSWTVTNDDGWTVTVRRKRHARRQPAA